MNKNFPFTINPLPYGYDVLEPVIDKQTMEIHHDKHHQAYADNLNKILEQNADKQKLGLEELMKSDIAGIKNNAGGVYNHDFFWSVMTAPNTSKMSESLKVVIEKNFETVDEFMSKFELGGLGRFGSGWVWLVKTTDGKLEIVSTANQDNPLSDGRQPVLGLDVWEHAYYLKYQNKRVDYVKAFWQIVNWVKVEDLLNNS
ncbi:superoxide dismutase [Candidatus Collierbacteria bacterium RIFOXYD1_FULL_40_9]|uniref:Superoxide dismutase n=1 Tax=Candidatus Collierbacteria bacterium RIFOXYD1_FULL_40_9 TaxID=1817731 RepID=A0A1F5FVC9_9BACT|nr:MAG: superoxide dismutase [Candidatus Collierbacteria bacterium RIFOXYD1_FULL_40_9]